MSKFLLTILLLLSVGILFAQDQGNDEGLGEIEEEELIIRKGKEIKLPPANRNYKKIKIEIPKSDLKNVDFTLSKSHVGLSPLDPAVRVKTLRQEALEKLYGGYVRGGAGNFASTNLELYFENKRNKEVGYGFFADHLASGRGPGENQDISGENHQNIGLFGELVMQNSLGQARMGYQRDQVSYYGFDQRVAFNEDTLDLDHSINRFYTKLGLRSFDPASYFAYRFSLDYDFTGNNFSHSEHFIRSGFEGDYEINPSLRLGAELKLDYSSYGSDTLTYGRALFSGTPYVKLREEKFDLKVGIRVAYENDTILDNDIHFYPSARFSYHLIPKKLDAYLGVDGGPQIHSFSQATRENAWLGQNVYLGTFNEAISFSGGVQGNLSSSIWYDVGIRYKTIDQLPLYINSFSDTSRFLVLYEDGNSTLFQVEALLNWQLLKELSLEIEGRLNNYSMARSDRAWHLPSTELNFRVNYFLRKKVLFKGGLVFKDGIYAFNSIGQETKLDPIIDLGFGIDYFISPRFTIFADASNLLGKNYQRYLNYPVKGFNFIAGASYSF